MKFRLNSGAHEDANGRYSKGDIIETDTDLVAKFNDPTSRKFEKLPDNTPMPTKEELQESDSGYTKEELSELSVADLRQIAEDLEIDLSKAKKNNKGEFIRLILAR